MEREARYAFTGWSAQCDRYGAFKLKPSIVRFQLSACFDIKHACDTETDRDAQTDRQTDRQTDTQTDRNATAYTHVSTVLLR